MPKIYEYLGLIFFFYANEHLPIHVHVTNAGRESKFELKYENGILEEITEKVVKGREELMKKEKEQAKLFIKEYHEGIIEKWKKFFVQKEKVICEIINKKI
jgi:hypothetical protein